MFFYLENIDFNVCSSLRTIYLPVLLSRLKQYKVFLLIIDFLFLITTFYCNATAQYTIVRVLLGMSSSLLHA